MRARALAPSRPLPRPPARSRPRRLLSDCARSLAELHVSSCLRAVRTQRAFCLKLSMAVFIFSTIATTIVGMVASTLDPAALVDLIDLPTSFLNIEGGLFDPRVSGRAVALVTVARPPRAQTRGRTVRARVASMLGPS